MLSDLFKCRSRQDIMQFVSQCPLEHCMLSDDNRRGNVLARTMKSQCPLEHCMLSDPDVAAITVREDGLSLNALSSIVCFLT